MSFFLNNIAVLGLTVDRFILTLFFHATESMSVTVCKHPSASQPLGITYRQRDFGQMLDCTRGECTFHEDSATNPVGFVALNSHDVYPFSARELVYGEAYPLEFWINLQAVLTVDRTAYMDLDGNTRRFSPSSDNVIRLAEQEDIVPDASEDSQQWGAFGGRWGRSSVSSEDLVSEYPFCFGRNTLSFVECPTETEDPVFLIVMQMLGVNSTSNPMLAAAKALSDFLIDFFADSVSAPTGPAAEAYYSRLNGVGNAPIWDRISSDSTGAQYCQELVDNIPDTTRLPADSEVLPLVKNVIGIVLMCIGFTFLSICYFVFWKTEGVRPLLEKDEDGRYMRPSRSARSWVYRKLGSIRVLGWFP